jgi:hypothetical protein
MIKLKTPIQRLICPCCGSVTNGRQWHNQDIGYGLCVSCVEPCKRKLTAEEFQRCYGVRGNHFDV